MTDTIHEQFARIAIAIGMEFDPPRDVADRVIWLFNKAQHDRERVAELETKILRGIATVDEKALYDAEMKDLAAGEKHPEATIAAFIAVESRQRDDYERAKARMRREAKDCFAIIDRLGAIVTGNPDFSYDGDFDAALTEYVAEHGPMELDGE